MRAGTRCSRVPSGPVTFTPPPADASTVTPLGISMGFLPIRLIALPDEGEDLAADASLGGLAGGDHAGRRGQDRGAEPAEDAWEAVLLGVDATPGLGDARAVGGDALAVLAELELDHEVVHGRRLDDAVALDVALLVEQARDLLLHARGRHGDRVVHRAIRVANPAQHVCDRIGQHCVSPTTRLRRLPLAEVDQSTSAKRSW